MSPTGIETARLRLASWDEIGPQALYALHADARVNRYMVSYTDGWSPQKAAERVALWQAEQARHGLGKHPVIRKADGAFVGRAGFSLYGEGPPELGYSLAPDHWGQGYASEIAMGLRDWFFGTRADPAFIGFAHRDNAASRRVLEKIGMTATHEAEVAGAPHQFYAMERT